MNMALGVNDPWQRWPEYWRSLHVLKTIWPGLWRRHVDALLRGQVAFDDAGVYLLKRAGKERVR